MQILLVILGVIVGIIVLILLLALIAPKKYHVSRDIVINRSSADVFNYARFIKNQDYYNKWVMMDPDMKKKFRGTDGTVGFVYGWNGNKRAGEGEQEIKGLKENELVDLEVRFVRPFAAVAKTPITITAQGANQTQLKWSMSSEMKYPMNFMLLFMSMDKVLGKDLETTLNTLKGILEKP
jgi:hypothetical protein